MSPKGRMPLAGNDGNKVYNMECNIVMALMVMRNGKVPPPPQLDETILLLYICVCGDDDLSAPASLSNFVL